MTKMRALGVGVAAVIVLGMSAGAACRLFFDCHARSVPVLRELAEEGGALKDLEERGTRATSLPEGFRQEVVAGGLKLPSAFALLPDGRILIAQKDGLVRVWRDGSMLPRPFIDLRSRVDGTGLRGLVAIEPHPGFLRNGWVYVQYAARSPAGEGRPTVVHVSRVKASGDTAAPRSEEIILGRQGRAACAGLPVGADCIPLDGDHGGGRIAFSKDGAMLVSTGDGHGSAGPNEKPFRAQSLDWLSGKLLRVTPEGEGLRDNPFWTGDAGANRSKIWALGLRNPFRFAIRPTDGAVWVADVGWDIAEELNRVVPGGNYGWPCYEGRERPEPYSDSPRCRALYRRVGATKEPLLTYKAASITGGTFLHSDRLPARYDGAYLFGDWVESWLRLVAADSAAADAEPFAENAAGPVQIEQAADGSIVYLALNSGELRRIVYEDTEAR